MARIIFTWEIGSDFGHIGGFLPVAHELRRRGHEVTFIIRDLANAEILLGKQGFTVLQAPIWIAPIKGLPNPPVNYSEIILYYGFINTNALAGLTRAWMALFALLSPAVVIADHSPVALLAALASRIPRAMIGTGFFSPPHMSPLPNMRPWLNVPQERLEQADRHVVAVANSVLAALSASIAPLTAVAELFKVDEDFLCTLPELDHYPQRLQQRYWGPRFNQEFGELTNWPQAKGKRIFAYLKSGFHDHEKVLQALSDSEHAVLVFSPGMPLNKRQKYQSQHLHIATDPINLSHIATECDLAICHAGHGTVAAMLLAGVPLLLLPMQLEQYLVALRVQEMGAGRLIHPEIQESPDYPALLDEMLVNRGYRQKAREFALRHADFSQQQQLIAMADRLEAIVRGVASSKAD